VDRVGFPHNYRETFKQLYVFDNPQNRQIRVVWGNEIATQVLPSQPFFFPYGSVLLFEDYPAILDAQGNPALDADGRFLRGQLRQLFVMKKEPTFGEAYGQNRNGEWEYVAYRPDGTYSTPPQASASCAACHLEAGGARDFVFRAHLYFANASGGVPNGVMKHYTYVPDTIRVKAGSTVTIYNDDILNHTVTADDGSFDSGLLPGDASFTIKANQPGEIPFHCNRHSRMRGKIIVEP
jgi:plastocyanin